MKVKVLLMGIGLILALSGLSLAVEQVTETKAAEQKENVQAAPAVTPTETKVEEENKLVEVGNKICPVSGEKVGQMGEIITYENNGKVCNLCCKMCEKDFKKDPEKFSKIAEEAAQKEKVEAGTNESDAPSKNE